jgi:ATP-dependent helicase/nuclease subunit B
MIYSVERYQGKKYFQSKRTQFMTKRLQNELVHSVWAMWHQMQEGDFRQFYAEKRFSGGGEDGLSSLGIDLGNGHALCLNGIIDRVDVCQVPEGKLIKIVDYKSSDTMDLSLSQVYHGLQMQLPVYLMAARELLQRDFGGEVIPAALLYYAMKEKNMEWRQEDEVSRQERALKEMRCKGYVNEEPSIVKHLDPHVVNGDELIPVAESSLFPIQVDKAGEYMAKSQVMSTEQFERLMEHTGEKMKDCGERIMSGEIAAVPYAYESRSGCDYCDYRSICGREERESRDRVCRMEKMSDDQVWEVLYEQD